MTENARENLVFSIPRRVIVIVEHKIKICMGVDAICRRVSFFLVYICFKSLILDKNLLTFANTNFSSNWCQIHSPTSTGGLSGSSAQLLSQLVQISPPIDK